LLWLGLHLRLALIGTAAAKMALPITTASIPAITTAATTITALSDFDLRDWLGPLRNYLLNLHFHCALCLAFGLTFGAHFAALVDSLNALIAAISLCMGGHEAGRCQQQSKGEITHRL
jgi:hypothetical protein